eukprot:SAG31_NODE_2324_length_5941_cov_1.960801_3_plen_72_part_00
MLLKHGDVDPNRSSRVAGNHSWTALTAAAASSAANVDLLRGERSMKALLYCAAVDRSGGVMFANSLDRKWC